jgi:phospholipid transport system substrate-binding protein
MRKPLYGLLGAFLALWCAFSPVHARATDPEGMVRETTDQVLNALKGEARKGTQDAATAERLVYDEILPLIHFPTFAKLVLGKHWQTATPEQRTRFTREFQNMLIRTYAKYMLGYAETRVNYLSTRNEGGKYTFVNTQLIPGQGKTPLQVSYRFKKFGEDWKAIDVTVDGLSMAKNFRTSFTEEVNQGGLDALISRLTKANASSEIIENPATKPVLRNP